MNSKYNVTNKPKKPLPAWLPFAVGALLVVQFAGLSVWQISRGLEKRATQLTYKSQTGFSDWHNGMDIRSYQHLRVTGYYDAEHQILLENIIINSRYGYYIITPLLVSDDAPVLLVNRGWLEKTGAALDLGKLALPDGELSVRGRAGSLPRAGYKMGESIDPASAWPKAAVYPSLDEVSAALGREVQNFVLLMDHEEQHGFLRHWVPSEFGPSKHFAYAVQWFAMGAVLFGLLVWNYRQKNFNS